ncbi:MAG: 16S rRNA (cytosine(1402)-N(4))-methyltransferase RsmH [Holosporales bacterium]
MRMHPTGMADEEGRPHIPVMLKEIVAGLQLKDGGLYIDGTFGFGGYTQALLEAAACRVIAFDRDPDAIAAGQSLCARYPERLRLIHGRFGDMLDRLSPDEIGRVDGVVLDLGVSSHQLDEASRGFSFRHDGPLDMRMEQQGLSAADVVNTLDEQELARIIYELGEERFARSVARAIVRQRSIEPFATTRQLAEVVRRVVRRSPDGIDPATRTFQGLRLFVNDELGELTRGLEAARRMLAPHGRLVVVTFHSLEDRIVKNFMVENARTHEARSRHLPPVLDGKKPDFHLVTRRAVMPSADEIKNNVRARSAKMRIVEKLSIMPEK